MAGPDDPVIPAVEAAAVVAPVIPQTEAVVPVQADPAAAVSDAPAAVVEASPAPAAAEPTPVAEPSLLDEFDKAKAAPKAAEPAKEESKAEAAPAAEAKPAEPKVEEAKPVEEKPAEVAPVEEPKVEESAPLEAIDYFAAETGLKIPETIKIDDAIRGELTGAFDLIRGGKAIEGAQVLMEMHNRQLEAMAKQVGDDQWSAFRKTNADWKTAVMADPILGGAGHDTAMQQVAIARDNFASTAKPGTPRFEQELAEFNAALRITGAGNNPAILRFMHNASKFVREAAPPPPDPKPPKDNGRQPGRKGLSSIYTHPTSNPEN